MRFWLVAFRVASALLLISVAVDMIGEDILEQVIHKTESAQNLPCPDNGISDDCFCCCAHVVLMSRVRLCREELESFLELFEPRRPSVIDLDPLYHPPRA
ncbi:MAG TPA: hypothetical protein VHZ07_04190 [Bryobacteraceae bacterium]|jgi:hypothetical protein|nr:hypothetical protein [Bryobacteraceae bacterium]